jgi:hypothetical protein
MIPYIEYRVYGVVCSTDIYDAVAVPIIGVVITDRVEIPVGSAVVYRTVIVLPILWLGVRGCDLQNGFTFFKAVS